MTAIVMVGRKGNERQIRWLAVILNFLMQAASILIVIAAIYLIGRFWYGGLMPDGFFIALRGGLGGGLCVVIVNLILRLSNGLSTPIDKLPELK